MNIGVHSLWPTLLLEANYGEKFQSSIDDIIDKVEFIPAPSHWGKTHSLSKPANYETAEDQYVALFEDDVISRYGLEDLHTEIDNLAKEFCNLYGLRYGKYKRTSWFTLFEKGNYAHVHNHMCASISGCFYYKTNGNDGNIFFKTPLPQISSSPAYAGAPTRHAVQVTNGKMILFPGWLDHGVMTNETDEKRISLAFNIEFIN